MGNKSQRVLDWLNRRKPFRSLTRQELAWVLYDVGNSAFTMLSCSLIPIWFSNLLVSGGVMDQTRATGTWGAIQAVVTVFVAILGPICGAITDHKDTRKIIFQTTVAAGVVCCIINGFVTNWILFMIVYMLSRFFYQASLTFYDSMLNDVTTEQRADQVSSYGYAWGYIGSCIPFIIALIAYVLGPAMVGILSDAVSKLIGFTFTGLWWIFATLPLLKNYKQRNYVEGKIRIGSTLRENGATLKRIVTQDKKVLFFLIAFFLYIDGVGTIIDNCVTLGKALDLNDIGLIIFLLGSQVVAWISSVIFAKLTARFKTVSLLLVCICGYTVVSIYALFIRNLWDFAIMAFIVGCFQGSIQSLSRSYYAKIIPAEKSGEYFGIYDIFAKGASFLGSGIIALLMFLGDDNGKITFRFFSGSLRVGCVNLAMFALGVFFVLGFLFLKLSDSQKHILPEKESVQ